MLFNTSRIRRTADTAAVTLDAVAGYLDCRLPVQKVGSSIPGGVNRQVATADLMASHGGGWGLKTWLSQKDNLQNRYLPLHTLVQNNTRITSGITCLVLG